MLTSRFKPYPGLLKVHFNVEDLQVWDALYLRYMHQDWSQPLPSDPLCPGGVQSHPAVHLSLCLRLVNVWGAPCDAA